VDQFVHEILPGSPHDVSLSLPSTGTIRSTHMSLTFSQLPASPLALMSPCSASTSIKPSEKNAPASVDFYIFGGYLPNGDDNNALIQYSTSQSQWKIINSTEKNSPKGRSAASLICRNNSSLVLYGGMECNDCWEFSLTKKQWTPLTSDTLPPTSRSNHTAIYLKRLDTMLVYGGTVNSDELSNGFIHLYSFAEAKWKKFRPKDRPEHDRLDHTAVLWKDSKMVVFGGIDEEDNSLNDVWSLSCAPHKWSPIGMSLKWTKLECSGQIPEARSRHAATIVDSRMFIFGGSSNEGYCLDDLYMLELNSNVWQKLDVLQPLLGRNGHIMQAIAMAAPQDQEESSDEDNDESSDDDAEDDEDEDEEEEPLPGIFIMCGNDKDFKVLDQADLIRQATFKEIMAVTNPQSKEKKEVFLGFNYSLQIEYGMIRKRLECQKVMSLDSLYEQIANTLGLKASESVFQWKNEQGKWDSLVNPRPDLDSIGRRVLAALPSKVTIKVDDK